MSVSADVLSTLQRASGPMTQSEIRAQLDFDDPAKAAKAIGCALVGLVDRGAIEKIERPGERMAYVAVAGYKAQGRGGKPGRSGRPRKDGSQVSRRAQPWPPAPAETSPPAEAETPKITVSVPQAKTAPEIARAITPLLAKAAETIPNPTDGELAFRLACAVHTFWQGPRASMPIELQQLTTEAMRRAA